MAEGRFVAYLRVSTKHQGAEGLGIEAQRDTVRLFLNGGAWEVVAEYVEVESGRRSDRPALAKALAHCRATGAALVVANVSRLTRSSRFLTEILDAGVEIRFCDLPKIEGATGQFLLRQMASVAELEAELIGERTKRALAARKKTYAALTEEQKEKWLREGRAISLGGARAGAADRARALGSRGAQAQAVKARARAGDLAPILEDVRAAGIVSLAGIAGELNRRGIKTPRGGAWYASSVRNLVGRLPA